MQELENAKTGTDASVICADFGFEPCCLNVRTISLGWFGVHTETYRQ